LFHSFNFLIVEEIFNRYHIQKLNHSACSCAVLSYWKLFVIWHCFMHLNVNIFLKTFTSSLNFEPFVFYLQLIQRFDSFFGCPFIIIFKESITFVHTVCCRVFY
jgi:hypothetical protein